MAESTKLNLTFIWIPRTIGWLLLGLSSILTVLSIWVFPMCYVFIIHVLPAIASILLLVGVAKKNDVYFNLFFILVFLSILMDLFTIISLWAVELPKHKQDPKQTEQRIVYLLIISGIYSILFWVVFRYFREIQKPVPNEVAMV